MAKIEIPSFTDKGELFDFLVENKDLHIEAKKSETKHADSVAYQAPQEVTKANSIAPDANKIQVKSVINTTKFMDSHSDVHIDGLWKKSLKENKSIMLLQEHKMSFDHLISKAVKASAEMMSFKSLGFGRLKGESQALVFDSVIDKATNEFMFAQYAKGIVDNHSVGMRYVKLFLAINSDSSEQKEEFDVWNKYIDSVANQKTALDKGFFWAVTEAKIIEGSAVLMGSNQVTPTLSVESKDFEAGNTTSEQSRASTQKNTRRRFY